MVTAGTRTRWHLLLALGGVILVAVVWWAWWWLGEPVTQPGERAVAGIPAPPSTETLTTRTILAWYEAVGTVQARTSARLAARIQGQVAAVHVDVGDAVSEGQVLVRLQSRELEARLAQARQGLAAAEAQALAARQAFRRGEALLAQEALATQEFERLQAEHHRAEAELESARQRVAESGTVAGYRELAAPVSGVVRRRLVDPGDLAVPGQTLLEIHDAGRLRLEALVREGLVRRLSPGTTYPVRLHALDGETQGTLTGIVPAADPRTRTVQIRLDLPADEGWYPGMYGTVRIPLEARAVVLVPRAAVITVGQLDTVLVRHDQADGPTWQRHQVTLGEIVGDRQEVLSGLRAGEVIGWR